MNPGTNRYTDGSYAETWKTWHDEDSPFKARWATAFLRDFGVRPRSVCDVGCGSGGFLAELRREWPDARAIGYDISPDAVQVAQELHGDVDVRLGDAAESRERFDLVLLMDVLEHVEDYVGFLRRIAPLGAQMLFHIPLDMTALMVARDRPILAVREAVGHLHYFSKATALATLADAGYAVTATRYTPGTLELPNRSARMKLAQWPRRIGFRISPDLTVRTLGGYALLVLATPVARPAESSAS